MDFSRLIAYLDSLEQRYAVPGFDMIITRDHETVFRHMGGCSDYEKRVPVCGRELYYIFSATKVITMTAAMQLIQQGKMSLDDPVSRYLPEFADMQVLDSADLNQWPPVMPSLRDPHHPASAPITLRMLMTMTSGLSYATGGEPILRLKEESGNHATTREMMKAIAEMPLLFEPGAHYYYSLGHDVIAGVIEVVSGLPFAKYLEENIFRPLGITDMYFHPDAGQRARLMAQYAFNNESPDAPSVSPLPPENNYCLTDRYDSGGAGLCCSVEAYGAFAEALANGGVGRTGERILSPEGIALLSRNQLNEAQLRDFRIPRLTEYGYGLGVRTLLRPELSPTPLGEFGWDGAAGAYMLADPLNRIGIFYAQEVRNMLPVYNEIHPTLRNLAYEALGNIRKQ